jgi:glycosyltransferase involved in cell wall biosynthesis
MLKIALVHDHLVQDGGAEKVLKAFCELYPKSPIFTIVYDKNGTNSFFVDKVVKTSYIQKIPGGVKNYQWYLSLMPSAVENQCLDDYDLIISSASSFAKGVITRPGVKHICYCHTPTRYLWNDSHNYLRELKVHWLIKKILPLTLNKLRLWDRLAAERVDYFIANSQTVSERIKKYYNREAVVIYPPVDIDRFKISNSPKQYFLAGGRLVAYKRFDLIVKAFSRLGIPVKIFGIGPELSYLKKIAKLNVEFLGKIDDAKK